MPKTQFVNNKTTVSSYSDKRKNFTQHKVSKDPKISFSTKAQHFSKKFQNQNVENRFSNQKKNFQQRYIPKTTITNKFDGSNTHKFCSNSNLDFVPQKPNFPNPSVQHPSKVLYTKGFSQAKNIDHWLEGKGRMYQSRNYSQQQIKDAYEKYVNTSSTGSLSSNDLNVSIKKWRVVVKATHVKSQFKRTKDDVSNNPKLSKNYVSSPLPSDVDLIDSFNIKICDWVKSTVFNSVLKTNFQGPKQP